jgi:hypothetical protein
VQALSGFPPAELEHLVFAFQPSFRLHSSSYPVFTVWQANQNENAPSVDQSLGGEQGMVLLRDDRPQIQPLAPPLFSFLSALHGRATLGDATTATGFDERELLDSLAFLFREELVSGLELRS